MTPPLTLTFTAHGVAQPKGSTRVVPKARLPLTVYRTRDLVRAVAVTSDNVDVKRWQAVVGHAAFAATATAPSLRRLSDDRSHAFALTCVFHLPRPTKPRASTPIVKPDLDKLVRAVCDALTGIVWKDDAQLTAITAAKRYAENVADCRVECIVTVLESEAIATTLRRRIVAPEQLPLVEIGETPTPAAAPEPSEPPHAFTAAWLHKAGAVNVTVAHVAAWTDAERTAARTWAFAQVDAHAHDADGVRTSVLWPEHVSKAHYGDAFGRFTPKRRGKAVSVAVARRSSTSSTSRSSGAVAPEAAS